MKVDKITTLINNGSILNYDEIRDLNCFISNNKNKDIDDIYDSILDELESIAYDFVHSNVINGISSNIVVGGINLNINGGARIWYPTEYDIASVSKLFTLILVLKYIDKGIFKLDDKVCDIDSNFKYLDYTIYDLLMMSGSIKTLSRIDEANSYDDALNILYSVYPVNYDKSINNYTDIGFMVLSKILEDITDIKYEDLIINFYKEYGIDINILDDVRGNGYNDKYAHDPKSRIMGLIGSAGIIINSSNMDKFIDKLINCELINKEELLNLSKKRFESNHPNKGIAGIYVKHLLGIKKSSTPLEYSKYAFSHQGYTGSCVIVDPINKIHNNILVDAIKEDKKKDKDFYKYFNLYFEKLVLLTLKTYMIEDNQKIKMIRKFF